MIPVSDRKEANQVAQACWEANAAFWDERMGDEGNDFVAVLIWPVTQRLLELRGGERVLDIACGNGLYSRRLPALGASVLAFDASEAMVARAEERTTEYADRIEYHVLDATDEAGLLSLGERQFGAAICQMALMDMAEIEPLMNATARLLKPGGDLSSR